MSYSHGGTCAFCGTEVDVEFRVCKGCGATWQEKNEAWQLLLGFLIFGAIALGLIGFGRLIDIVGISMFGIFLVLIWGALFFTLPMTAGRVKAGQRWYR